MRLCATGREASGCTADGRSPNPRALEGMGAGALAALGCMGPGACAATSGIAAVLADDVTTGLEGKGVALRGGRAAECVGPREAWRSCRGHKSGQLATPMPRPLRTPLRACAATSGLL